MSKPISSSAHVVRKTGVVDTAFNHKLYDVLDDDHTSDDSDNEKSETKNQNFEFSDSYGVMRFIKLIVFIQIIGLMLDHPSSVYSATFRIICRGVIFYSTQFYSKPFIDLLYLLQYFLLAIIKYIQSLNLPTTPSDGNINFEGRRQLNTNPYSSGEPADHTLKFTLDVIDDRSWHTIKQYSHYILGVLFVVMSILFTLKFWQISDYSNRNEVKKWLGRYITDGWWRKGGLGVAVSMGKAVLLMGGGLWFLVAISAQFNTNAIPDPRIVGATIAIGIVVVFVIWLLGYFGIRTTEAAFIRYVSQNVSYTSAIILKRAVKAKLDLGILLISIIYMPLLYTLMQSLIVITDWNDTLAPEFRHSSNYYVPCYFMAFPPHRREEIGEDFCPVAGHTAEGKRVSQYYRDANTLPCDSYLGITVYTVSAVLFVYLVLGYAYMLHSMISLVTKEFQGSKWVDVLHKLMRIREEEVREYEERFSAASRNIIAAQLEVVIQLRHVQKGLVWMVMTVIRVIKGTIRGALRPLFALLIPINFLLNRLLVLSCFNFLTAEGRERSKQQAALRRKSKVVKKRSWLRASYNRAFKRPSSAYNDLSRGSNPSSGLAEHSQKFDFETDMSMKGLITGDVDEDLLDSPGFADRVMTIDIGKYLTEQATRLQYSLNKVVATSTPVVWLKVKIRMCMDHLYAAKNDGANGKSYASFGGNHATWRSDQTLMSKTRLIRRLKQHILTELRLSKINFVAEHELVIAFLDHTVDSSGLFTWVVLYDYAKMYWFLVVFAEMTLLAVLSGVCNTASTWEDKNYIFIGMTILFGLLTYTFDPYTEELDRWLEFCGRGLVITIAAGTIICHRLSSHKLYEVNTQMYTPWRSTNFLVTISERTFGVYEFVDIGMVVYFYCYLCYILYVIGFFGVVDRAVKSFQFGYHDHILDYLVEKLDERTIGMENVFTGLQLVQQWDDIIKLQRRYALLSWPDVRPSNLMTLTAKLFEIKWASMFNLTLNNLRSSLGLSILHTVMFSADGDVAKWIMHTNPDLLKVTDSQNDTPVTIALKECAYFLVAYGEQNEGSMDDGTSYSDEQYSVYYPEVDDIRDDVFQNGEFQHDKCTVRMLTSKDLRSLREDGVYIEPSAEEEAKKEKDIADAAAKKLQKKGKNVEKVDIFGNVKVNEEEVKLEKEAQKRARKERKAANKVLAEKQSVWMKRFPEDAVHENFETGQMLSWGVIGLAIPDENIFLDNAIMKRTHKDPTYRYNDAVNTDIADDESSLAFSKDKHGNTGAGRNGGRRALPGDGYDGDNENKTNDPHAHEDIDLEKAVVVAPIAVIEKDLEYVVHTERHANIVDENWVPLDHIELKAMLDFDKKRKKKRNGRRDSTNSSNGGSARKSSISGGSVSANSQTSHGSGSTMFDALTKLNSVKADRETRWKICKFAEILMSEEIARQCSNMKWKITDFKAFNKLASIAQGKIAQNLALVCHLNPPAGFARLSDWSKPLAHSMFDEQSDENIPMIVKGVVAIVSAAEKMTTTATAAIKVATTMPELSMLRGRKKRRRTSRSLTVKQDDDNSDGSVLQQTFSDRVIHFLAEAYICSTDRVNLDDAELSYNACIAWRAIARALRRKHCTFILPSLFVPPKLMLIKYLELPRNELDCGDCVYLADIFTHQPTLLYVDLSFNRIGSRGMTRMCKALKDNKTISTFRIDHNIIGPACGKDVGIWLKQVPSLKCLSMSHNRMGEIIRFPTLYSREKIASAAHDIFLGVRYNRSLETLDLSYNHLGPTCADVVPIAVNKHVALHTLNLSGNDIGPTKGPHLIFCLSGFPGGARFALEKEKFIANIKKRQTEKLSVDENGNVVEDTSVTPATETAVMIEGDVNRSSVLDGSVFSDGQQVGNSAQNSAMLRPGSHVLESPSKTMRGAVASPINSHNNSYLGLPMSPNQSPTKGGLNQLSTALSTFKEENEGITRPAALTSLSLADNQIGEFGGHAIACLIERNKNLTHLDISGNSLSHVGGMLIMDQLELSYSIKPRDFLKIVLWEIEEKKYTGRNAKRRKKVYTHLTSLNLSRNGFGPNVMASLMYSVGHPNCTITDLDVSDNPLGYSIHAAGAAGVSAQDIRTGLEKAKSLRQLNMARTAYQPVEIVPIFGGLSSNEIILRLEIEGIKLDEPSCLQLCNVLSRCSLLVHVNFKGCRMGANGGTLIANKVGALGSRLEYVDLTENFVGQIAAIYLAQAIKDPKTTIHTLRLAHNDLGEQGGTHVAKALVGNVRITDLDLSSNYLTFETAVYVADAARGLFENGLKVSDSKLKRFLVNDNPEIGTRGAKLLIKSLANDHVEHLELCNISAQPGAANLISTAIRDPTIAWRYLDVGGNMFSRIGLNQIYWALRQNKRMRIFKCSDNKAGTIFCSNSDALLRHGISVPTCLRSNSVLREIDLSFNGLSTEAGINILDAMIDNHTVKKLSLRGNIIDDNVALMLPDLLRCNNVLEELDLGQNRLGFTCAYAIAESLEVNRSLKVLVLDYNRFGGAGQATLDIFCRSLMMNFSLQILVFDGNKLGPEWGVKLAEAFARNNTLVQVSLRDNRLDARAGRALFNAFRHCPYMLEMAVSADEIGRELWEQFRATFDVKRACVAVDAIRMETKLTDRQLKQLESYAL